MSASDHAGVPMALEERVAGYLRELTAYPDRHVGGPGNHAAGRLFAEVASDLGLDVQRTTFDCIDWEHGGASLMAEGEPFDLHVGPYSPPCDATARLVVVTDAADLERIDGRGAVILLRGAVAKSQIMPKNFTFYNPESHRHLVSALEPMRPAAVIAATGRDPQMVGSQYPFPLFEDGDLDFPSAYMTDVDGERLAGHEGADITVRIDSRRVPASGEQIVAVRPGTTGGRIVVTAHIDSRVGSPGALDNASGVAVLLGLAELLADHMGGPSVELVPFNGEDDYANPGEMLWLAQNEGRLDDVLLAINIDDAAQVGTVNHVSFYGCPPDVERIVRDVLERSPRMAEGPQWFQSDHAIFSMHGRPAIAIASSDIEGFMAHYAHSARDTLELADPMLVADVSRFIRKVIDVVSSEA